MNDVTAEVKGLPELKAAFHRLSSEIAAKILKAALQAGADVLKNALTESASAHTRTGEMKAAITAAVDITPSGTSGVARVGFGKQSYKAKWVEFGHRQVVMAEGERKEVGHVPAHPFVRPAYESSKEEARRAVMQVIQAGVKDK